ncbi:MAG: hypothetical protein HUJ68_08320, partial [Clostridia bacterium]|nr:hypothetical protein [Clostridia bacterium]
SIINKNQELESSEKFEGHIYEKFPFHLYKREAEKNKRYGWEIEHILSNHGDCEDDKNKLLYLYSAKGYVSDESLKKKIEEYLKNPKEENYSAIGEDVDNELGNKWCTDNSQKNKIWNFTLLDSGTNQEYQNAVYPFKRIFILNKEKGIKTKFYVNNNGEIEYDTTEKEVAFVPTQTKNVFVKNYIKLPENFSSWTEKDAEEYKNSIYETLKDFGVVKEESK